MSRAEVAPAIGTPRRHFQPSALIARQLVAERTIACELERPRDFAFTAGQYVDVTLPDPSLRDRAGPTRSFSIASPPAAASLRILLRLGETGYKRSLATAPPGSTLLLEGPDGSFVFPADATRPLVFIAGGVGVAPFLSMLAEAAAHPRPIDATLFYSNRRPEDAAELDTLARLERAVPGFHVVPTMTRMERSHRRWSGETTHIEPELLARYLPTPCGPRYYVAGSPGLAAGVRYVLVRELGVAFEDIKIEMFAGY